MEKTTECKIVEDLLFGYVDDVLNTESKKLVEKHLLECSNCQKKFKEIKQDSTRIENNQKNEIDYLRKIRKKNKIKSILIALGIIFTICFIIYLRNFIIFNNLLHKGYESLKNSNFYQKSTQTIGNNEVSVRTKYYKDGKYKIVSEIYSDIGIELISTEYSTVGSGEKIVINGNEKIATIEKANYNTEENIKHVPFLDNRLIIRLLVPAGMSISTGNYGIGSFDNSGKKCYIMKFRFDNSNNYQIWLDSETGLPLREVSANSYGTKYPYYPENVTLENTNPDYLAKYQILQSLGDNKSEYMYEFNIVTDKDVEVPDLSEYEIKDNKN